MESFYVTTPIFYINDVPSVGHVYPLTICDGLARLNRLRGKKTFFLTGLDENSVKTIAAAKKAGVESVQEYADEMAEKWVSTWRKLEYSNDDFIRTTQERHKSVVRDFFDKVYKKGDIYKGVYEGLYCEGCEAFVRESDLEDGNCALHLKPPKALKEQNYFFKLSKYQEQILEHIEKNPLFIQPASRRREIINFIKEGLDDTSISRPANGWGIPLPIDEKQVIWVWFDALINYLQPKEFWPADAHVVGKDIARFHCITWIGMLLSAAIELPKSILAHGFFTVNGQKMSKSLGNAIDPNYLAGKYGVDAIKYFVFREIPFGEDGDFSEKELKNRLNTELVANWSNLFYRSTSFGQKLFGKLPGPKAEGGEEKKLVAKIALTKAQVDELVDKNEFHHALEKIMELSSEGNKFFQDKKPWELRENAEDAVFYAVNVAANVSLLMAPFTPSASKTALDSLGVVNPPWGLAGTLFVKPGTPLAPVMLFKKI
ncbi:methionine--tRNA ligase [Candidatus Micrarchaeota archaeon]|nr:methionine--tRNA ligase [Candidatus Micrarchaeota archaeon]